MLLRHPGVSEVSVVGRRDPNGARVVAFVCRRGRASRRMPAELDALCLDQIARFKRPKAYRFVEDLPKNSYGKVLKTELRKLARAGIACIAPHGLTPLRAAAGEGAVTASARALARRHGARHAAARVEALREHRPLELLARHAGVGADLLGLLVGDLDQLRAG